MRPGNKLASLSSRQSTVKTKFQVQYSICSEIYILEILETEKWYGMLIFSVTSLKISKVSNR